MHRVDRGDPPDCIARFAWRLSFECKKFAPPAFGAVSARRGHTGGEMEAWALDGAAAEQPAHRLKGFRVSAKIHNGGDAAVKVSGQVFRPVAGDARDGCIGKMRMKIEKARQEGLSFGADDARVLRQSQVWPDGGDAAAAKKNISLKRRSAGAIHNGCAHDGNGAPPGCCCCLRPRGIRK